MYLKSDINISNNNPDTVKLIYETYKWEISNKLLLKNERVTFLLTWSFINKYHWYLLISIGEYNSINGVYPLYFIISKVDGYIEEKIEIITYLLLLRTKASKH